MRTHLSKILIGVVLCLAPVASWADLAPYSQDFEGLVQSDAGALGGDGWLVFGNVFDGAWNYLYGYGVFSAPNGGPGFSAIASLTGGPEQGLQQLVVYNDYANPVPHVNGWFVEANVFQEQTIGAADVGTIWRFEFDAKRGDIQPGTTAQAFFKTIDPASGFALTNFIPLDTTNLPDTWGRYSLSISIDPGLVGQLLQFGFLTVTTGFTPSGVLYDNVDFAGTRVVDLDIKPGGCPNPINERSLGLLPVALLGTGNLDVTQIDVGSLLLEGVAPVHWDYEDAAEPYAGDLCGCTEAGPDGLLDLTLKFDSQDIVEVIGASEDGTVQLTLTGLMTNGMPLEGVDCIVKVGRGGRASGEAFDRTNYLMLPPSSARKGRVHKSRSGSE